MSTSTFPAELTSNPTISIPFDFPADLLDILNTKVIDITLQGQIVHLLHQTDTKMAERVHMCGHIYKCLKHGKHIWRMNASRCMYIFLCEECRMARMSEYYRKHSCLMDLIPEGGGFLSFIFTPPLGTLYQNYDPITMAIRKALPRKATLSFAWAGAATPTLRVLYLSTPSVDQLKLLQATLPDGVKMSYTRHQRDNFKLELRHMLLDAEYPSSPDTLVDLQKASHHVRLFRTWGMTKAEKLNVYGSDTYTINSEIHYDNVPVGDSTCPHVHENGEVCGKHAIRKVPRCPICGESATHETRWRTRRASSRVSDDEWMAIKYTLDE